MPHRHNQNGFAHLQLLLMIIGVLVTVTFAAYRVGQTQSSKSKTTDLQDAQTVQEIKTTESNEEQEVAIPEEKIVVEPAPDTQSVPVETKKVEPQTEVLEPKKQDKKWLKMTKVSSNQIDTSLEVVASLPENLTGTCGFKLWQDGFSKVYTTTEITDSSTCSGALDLVNIPTLAGWTLFAWFDSSDGTVSASMPEEAITLSE